MLSNVDGSNEQVISTRKGGDRFSTDGPAWSLDGSMVVCGAGRWGEDSYRMNLFAFDVTDRRQLPIGQQSWLTIFQVAWENDNSLIVNAREHDASRYELWRVSFPDGAAQKLRPDLENYQGVSIANGKIVTARSSLNWRIWVANIGEFEKAVEIASGTGIKYGLSWTDSGKIVFSSMTPDRLNISRIDPDGSNRVQLTTGGDNYQPESSPYGRYIVFSSNLNGRFNIWRMNANGTELTQLTSSDGNFYPSVSPDNQWVVYDNVTGPVVKIFKVPLNGGEPIKIGEGYRMPVFSPNSQFIAGRYNLDANTEGVAIFPAQGGDPVRQFEIPRREWQRVRWISDNELSYIKETDGYSNIWSYNLNTGERKQLTNFSSDRIYAYDWSPDYKQIACQRGTTTSNVTMISER